MATAPAEHVREECLMATAPAEHVREECLYAWRPPQLNTSVRSVCMHGEHILQPASFSRVFHYFIV